MMDDSIEIIQSVNQPASTTSSIVSISLFPLCNAVDRQENKQPWKYKYGIADFT